MSISSSPPLEADTVGLPRQAIPEAGRWAKAIDVIVRLKRLPKGGAALLAGTEPFFGADFLSPLGTRPPRAIPSRQTAFV